MLQLFRATRRSSPQVESAPRPNVGGTSAEPATGRSSSDDEVDRLLDTLAQILRGYGKFALDLEGSPRDEAIGLCEAWAEHLTIGRSPPGTEPGDQRPQHRRNLAGARSFILRHREGEARAAAETVASLREVLWSFVQRMSRAIPEEAASDAAASAQLDRLRAATEDGSIERLRAEADRTVATLGSLLVERRARERERTQALGRQVQSLGERLANAEREAAIDPLTKLANRRTFDGLLENTAHLSALTGQAASLLIIDADRFKTVNDTHGHPAGDAVLIGIANALVRCFPARTDCVARIGGEEMGVLLTACGAADAERLAERALSAVRALRVPHEGSDLTITVSIGLAEKSPYEDAASWLARADRALYQAKDGGRDRLAVAATAP